MGKKLFVGNLPYSADDSALSSLFASVGTVESCKVIVDRETGRSKGFAFVEMSSDDEAAKAVTEIDGQDLEGRAIRVTEARPQEPRSGGGGGRGFGGGGGGGRGGGGGFGGGRGGGGRDGGGRGGDRY